MEETPNKPSNQEETKKLSSKEEHFCYLMFKGHSRYKAYKEAYACETYNTAALGGSRLYKKAHIASRVCELEAEWRLSIKWDKDTAAAELEKLRVASLDNDDPLTALKATQELNKLTGLTDKKLEFKGEITVNFSLEDKEPGDDD